MNHQLKSAVKTVYRNCTPNTPRGLMYSLLGSLMVFFYGTLFLGTIVAGANAKLTGETLQSGVTAIDAARFELWMDMATQDPLTRSVFGLMYPIIALAWTLGSVGFRLGYAVPELGYVVEGMNLLWPVVAIGFIAMQMIRFGQLARE